MSAFHDLIRSLLATWDPSGAQVLADVCEEKELAGAAKRLRSSNLQIAKQELVAVAVRAGIWDDVRDGLPRISTGYVALNSTMIPSMQQVSISYYPVVKQRILRWVIPSSIAFKITVQQVHVGAAHGMLDRALPGSMFVEDSTLPDVISPSFPLLLPGEIFSMAVLNHSESEVRFVGGLIVREVENE